MSHTPHELADDFPEHAERIHELKQSDAHFAELVDEYHDVNRTVHRMETEVEPVATHTEEDVRKKRVELKDKIAAYLNSSGAS